MKKYFAAIIFLAIIFFFIQAASAQQPDKLEQQGQIFDTWDSTDDGMKTGPAIGEIIPEFQAENQNGKLTSFRDIVGPNGALILFHRSADW